MIDRTIKDTLYNVKVRVLTDKDKYNRLARKCREDELDTRDKGSLMDACGKWVLYLRPDACTKTIVHECVHIKQAVFDYIGVGQDAEHEAAYIEWWFDKPCKLLAG